MHKGLYWSQLTMGIGIGLILAATIWLIGIQFLPGSEVEVVGPDKGDFIPSELVTDTEPQLLTEDVIFLAGTGVIQQVDQSQSLVEDLQGGVEEVPSVMVETNVEDEVGYDNSDGQPFESTILTEETQVEQVLIAEVLIVEDSFEEEPILVTDSSTSEQELGQEANLEEVREVIRLTSIPWIELEVRRGDNAREIGYRLEKLGLAQQEDFLAEVATQGIERRLRVGKYLFREGTSLQEIIKELTR